MKKVFVSVFVLLISFSAFSKSTEQFSTYNFVTAKKHSQSGFDRTRLMIGPGFGINAGYRAFAFSIAPSVSYALTNNFSVGTTIGFNYFQQGQDITYYNPVINQNVTTSYKFKLPAYSWSVYARYIIADMFMINFEPEINNTKYISGLDVSTTTGKLIEKKSRLTVPSVLVGAGYIRRFGDYGYSYVLVGYDLVQNPNARYYQTLDYKVGIMIPLFNR